MIPYLPSFVNLVFGLTTLLTLWFIFRASGYSRPLLLILLIWLALQALVSLTGFYTFTYAMPPRFMLLMLPSVLTIIILFITPWGRRFIDGMDIQSLTYLHMVRIPVELVLYWLFIYGQVPGLMTFTGRNFDIIAGITAPFIAYYGYSRSALSRKFLLTWNFICLALLLNIVINAALSAPFPFQQFGFEQPNIAVLYFPFVWLPGFIVPVVLFAHLAALRRLIIIRF